MHLWMCVGTSAVCVVLSYPAVFIHSGSGGCPDVRKEHPQGDLWKKYSVNFLGCQFIDGLLYNLRRRAHIEEWQER